MRPNVVERLMKRDHAMGEAYLVCFLATFGVIAALTSSSDLAASWAFYALASAIAAPFLGMFALCGVVVVVYIGGEILDVFKRRKET